MATMSAVLRKLGVQYNNWCVMDAAVSFEDFTAVMYDNRTQPYYASERSIREKWRALRAMGFVKEVMPVNGVYILSVDRICEYLSIDRKAKE